MKKYVLILPLLFAFFSCDSSVEQTEDDLTVVEDYEDEIDESFLDFVDYEIQRINKEFIFSTYEGDKDTTRIAIIYPFFNNDNPFGARLNDTIIRRAAVFEGDGERYKNMEDYANNFIENFKSYTKEMEIVFPWYNEIEIVVINNDEDIISISSSSESYTGGAHGAYFVTFENYDSQKETKIMLNDVFLDPNNVELLKIGEYYFKEYREIPQEEELVDYGCFESDFTGRKAGFYLNENFLFEDGRITFFYNPYEVASYAFGPTVITIPLEEIRPFLKNSYGF